VPTLPAPIITIFAMLIMRNNHREITNLNNFTSQLLLMLNFKS